jgi:hypothetical protein
VKSPQKTVNQIRDALAGGTDELMLQTLASEYAGWVRSANHRLEQCALMLSRGNEYQALVAAETHPPLMDLVATLSFKGSTEWKSLCQSRHLPVPERLDEQAVRSLNELYSKGVSPTHPFYKQYREAIFERNEEKALEILLTITRLNASDAVARTELERLQKRVVLPKIEQLEASLPTIDAASLTARLEELDRLDPRHHYGLDTLQRARQRRLDLLRDAAQQECLHLIETLRELRESSKTAEIALLIDRITSLRYDHGLTFDPPVEELFTSPSSWFLALCKSVREQAALETAKKDLEQWITEGPGRLTEAPLLPDPELKNWIEKTSRLLTAVDHSEAELLEQGRKLLTSFQAELSRRSGRRRAVLAAGAAVFIVVAGFALWIIYCFGETQPTLAKLQRFKEARQVPEARALMDRIENPFLFGNPFLKNADLLPYTEWLATEEKWLHDARTALGIITRAAQGDFTEGSLSSHLRAMSHFRELQKQVAPPFQEELEKELTPLQADWDKFLLGQRQRIASEFQLGLADMEQQIQSDLDYQKSPAAGRAALTKIRALQEKLDSMAADAGALDIIPVAQLTRFKAARDRADEYAAQVEKLDEGTTRLATATNIEDYLSALDLLASSYFVQAEECRLARNLLQTAPSIRSPYEELLFPGDHAGWAKFRTEPSSPPIPTTLTDEESALLIALRDEPDLRDIHEHKTSYFPNFQALSFPPKSTGFLFSRRPLASKEKQLQKEIIRTWSGQIYDPALQPDQASFAVRDLVFNELTGSQTVQGQRVDHSQLSTVSEAFIRLGLDDALQGPSMQVSLLVLFDRLRSAPPDNLLWKAYTWQELAKMAGTRHAEWGLHLTPALRQDIAALRDILRPELAASDWLVPRKQRQLETRLAEFFRRHPGLEYERQFRLHQDLASTVYPQGLVFAGWVNAQKEPVLLPAAAAARELWGAARSGKIDLLYTRAEPGQPLQPGATALPLTPLFTIRGERARIKSEAYQKAGVSANSAVYEPWLPPYFRGK